MSKLTLPVVEQPIGVVLYHGPSRINRKPIVVIASGFKATDNPKTGQMIQVWILAADMTPVDAYHSGQDKAVCGNCPHRKVDGVGSCYVNIAQAPQVVWKAWKRGRYAEWSDQWLERFRGRRVRFGAYGDPAAVPFKVLDRIRKVVEGWTAYTHQWRRADKRFQEICMASVDTPAELLEARAAGWRTFRTRLAEEPLLDREFACPASEESGKIRTCETCMACDGGRYNGKGTVAIIAHGAKSVRYINARRNAIALPVLTAV